MPRMTRAALKAQAQADEYPESDQQYNYLEKDQESQSTPLPPSSSSTLIHEDQLENETGEDKLETNIHNNTDDLAVRQALRDITDENYPKADLNVEITALSPLKHQDREEEEQHQEQEQDLQKSTTRKPRTKAKGRTKKKVNSPTVIEPEEKNTEELVSDLVQTTEDSTAESLENSSEQVSGALQEIPQQPVDEVDIAVFEETSEPGPAVEEDILEVPIEQSSIVKTPKFDPSIHISDEAEAHPVEDSFVKSITSRSPSKLGLSQAEERESSQPVTDSLQAFTPLRRTSSSRFEESFEALDSLEDTIEQLTAGLPLIAGANMDSPESPAKNNRRSVRILETPDTPKPLTTKTPRSTFKKSQVVAKSQDKENTPPVARTPLKSKTPLKAKTPIAKEATPLKARTPAIRHSSPHKPANLSIRKTRTPAATATSDNSSKQPIPATMSTTVPSVSPTKSSRQSTMVASAANRGQIVTKKPASTLQRKPSQRQPSVAPGSTRVEAATRKSTVPAQADKKAHQTSMSVSHPPAKQQPPSNTHKRRVTSGNVLSTSKPAFVTVKSTKPPTVATFALPGEAIAEKLKAQKEAREEKMKQPKVTIAEQKAAKLKADREAREERVRLNQIKAKEEAEEKENRKPQRPVSMSALTISKARAEAAERGRLASKEWAEKMLKKKAGEVKAVPVEAV